MATNFPASLDTLTNPTSSDSLSSPSHSAQHANVNDAVEALQAKVGADSSAVTTSHDYKIADHASRLTTLEGAAGSGLVFISRTTIGSAVSSVTVSGAFSSTYDNYRIVVRGVVLSLNENVGIQLSALTSGYKFGGLTATYAVSVSGAGTASGNKLRFGAVADSAGNSGGIVADVYGPNLAGPTSSTSFTHYGHPTVGGMTVFGAVETSSTQHTAFTFLPDSGTMTGGTIDVYGYVKS
jgi:hypothetical protein